MRAVTGFIFGLWVLTGAVLSGLVVGTIGVLPFVVLPRGKRFLWTMPAAQLWARSVLFLLGVRLEVRGQWPLEDHEGALIFCNHRSWLDPVVLMAITRSHGLSKRQILWIPVIGFYGWLAGGVFFDRNSRDDRSKARDDVLAFAAAGHRLQIFPEGTRNQLPGTREKVYLSLAMDAYKKRIPVVRCAIVGCEGPLPPGQWAAFWGEPVVLEILPPLAQGSFRSSRDYAQATWQRVRDAYARIADGE